MPHVPQLNVRGVSTSLSVW